MNLHHHKRSRGGPAGAAHALGLVTSHLVRRAAKTDNHFRNRCRRLQPAGYMSGRFGLSLKYYGSADNGQRLSEPLHTVTTKDRFGLVTIHGVITKSLTLAWDAGTTRTIAAQGFPSITSSMWMPTANGIQSAQVARCGNAVPPPFAESTGPANLPEMCTGSGSTLTLERYKEAVGAGRLEFGL